MVYPKWTPAPIVTLLERYASVLSDPNLDNEKIPELQRRASMWKRLATRKEMEKIWAFLAETDALSNLLTNGGLFGTINRAMTAFQTSPRLSKTDYKTEMLEISRLADALSNKLKKFCDAEPVRNPFPYNALLNSDQLEIIKKMMRPEILKHRHGFSNQMAMFALNDHFPSIYLQIKSLGQHAKEEALDQFYRLQLPRKTHDKHAFRTYFIRIVSDHFLINFEDHSPSRIATFCNVALDDPEITSDLVRKLYVLDEDMKSMRKLHRKN